MKNENFTHFTIVQRIPSGDGRPGKLYEARMEDGRKTAVTAITLAQDPSVRNRQIKELDNRMRLLTVLRHINVLRHFHVAYSGNYAPVRVPHYFIVTELCQGGTLEEAIRTVAMDRNLCQRWSSQLLQGLCYLHQKRITHGDLRGANVFLTTRDIATCTLKISNIGQSSLRSDTSAVELGPNPALVSSLNLTFMGKILSNTLRTSNRSSFCVAFNQTIITQIFTFCNLSDASSQDDLRAAQSLWDAVESQLYNQEKDSDNRMIVVSYNPGFQDLGTFHLLSILQLLANVHSPLLTDPVNMSLHVTEALWTLLRGITRDKCLLSIIFWN
ncbi:hypothetical protein BV898_05452 [Hypsibius exemplaris]|uniref:Protein kinase domain-containing protein n=1 Tax=Hypsibius exemplaris TaxID=2072580 RepID=A0A1W0WZP2_HYPEX|nr:hypothetical protein BV898_05452 [Hypsibius exemplaris]